MSCQGRNNCSGINLFRADGMALNRGCKRIAPLFNFPPGQRIVGGLLANRKQYDEWRMDEIFQSQLRAQSVSQLCSLEEVGKNQVRFINNLFFLFLMRFVFSAIFEKCKKNKNFISRSGIVETGDVFVKRVFITVNIILCI